MLANALGKLSSNPVHESKLVVTDIMDNLVIAQKKEDLEPILKSNNFSNKSISRWYEQINLILGCVPWTIDGKSII